MNIKKHIHCIILSICIPVSMLAQSVDTWKSHLSYHNTTAVVETKELVFAIANNSLYSYNREDNSIFFHSTLNGLSDTGVEQIGYNTETNKLIIIYTNGNIDFLTPGTSKVKNLPYMKEDMVTQSNSVQGIYFYKEYAYLSTSLGIVVINLKKEEIADTYKIQTKTYATCIKGNTIYVATDKGVLYAPLTANLMDYHIWQTYALPISLAGGELITQIDFFSDLFTFFVEGTDNNGMYCLQADNSLKVLSKDKSLTGMTIQNSKLIAYGTSFALVMSSLTDQFTIKNAPVNGISSLKDANTYWIAAGEDGLKGIRKNGNTFDLIVSDLEMDSPLRNLAAFMTYQSQKLLIAGGGRWANRNNYPGTLMVYEDDKWFNFDKSSIEKASKIGFKDVTSVAVDPKDENHYFASTWGEGVYEFKDNAFVKLYNHTNSTLETALPNSVNSPSYVRVEGLCFDSDNNLWMTNSSVSKGIKVMKADGTWRSFLSELNGTDLIDKILITKNNHKWINTLRTSSVVYVFDDKRTIDDTTDDVIRRVSPFYHTVNGVAASINASTYYCMIEDKKSGAIWIGTNIGPLICRNPQRAIDNPNEAVSAYRPIREGADGFAGYFLDGERVQAIAIDGGNRKWLGTLNSGVLVVSEDGSETIEHFTTENSPLPSNNIQSLAINPATGEVFIGTEKGIFSYMSGATEGEETFSDVHAYPNPVRLEQNDQVTITGLISDSNVKITDINGNLIYQAKSLGGQLTWNCRKKNGEQVATGIYLVLASQPDKGESVVTKIMVIK